MSTVRLTEAVPLSEAATGTPAGRKFRARLIEGDIWGTSGYYSAAVLQEAANAKVFGQGTMIFLDHPSFTEQSDRPERSVRDLAGRLSGDAVFESDGLYADIEVYPHVVPLIEGMVDDIGMSIRATAEVEHGEAAGRRGQIITRFDEAISVDFVTKAGAGGKVVSLMESAREQVTESRNIGQWIESRIHRDFTITADDMAGDGRLTREERIGLSTAIGDALAAFVTSLEANQPQLYTRDLWDDPQDTIAAAMEAARNVPVNPAGRTTTEESEEDTMPEIAESELARLREADGRVQTLESERDAAVQRAETAESERDQLREADARRQRTSRVGRILREAAEAAGVQLDEDTAAGIATRAVNADDGTLNESETRRVFDERIARLTESRPGGGSGVRGFGPGTTPKGDDTAVSESDLDALDDAVFGPLQIQEA